MLLSPTKNVFLQQLGTGNVDNICLKTQTSAYTRNMQHFLQRTQGANFSVLRHAVACFNHWCLGRGTDTGRINTWTAPPCPAPPRKANAPLPLPLPSLHLSPKSTCSTYKRPLQRAPTRPAGPATPPPPQSFSSRPVSLIHSGFSCAFL